MSKLLISYFSASGVTKGVAEKIATAVNGDLFEVEPVENYTDEDLDWRNKQSRSTIEMNNRSFRPPVLNKVQNINEYDKLIIGFPVWWYTAPTIINTFIESLDFAGKTLIPFCTSGGTGISGCEKDLRNAYPGYNWKEGKRLTGREDKSFIENWIKA